MVSCVAEESSERIGRTPDNAVQESVSKIPINKETQIAHAESAIKTFASTLQAELKKAIHEGGPLYAINVCNTRAMSITKKVSAEEDLKLGRVSLKNRNPNNVPNDLQRKARGDFETRKSKGEEIATLLHAEVIGQDNDKQFRYMKAIPTGKICVLCHGTILAPRGSK